MNVLLRALALLLVAALSARAADDLATLFPRLPASVFGKWAGEDPKPIADPANRARLIAAKADAVRAISTELHIRDFTYDSRHGFLSFGSDGDGEGTTFTMALWKTKDGTPLLGVAIEQWSNVANDTRHISFWRLRDGQLTDVSAALLPKLTLASFYEGRADRVKAAAAENYRWWWQLPQHGTTIQLRAPSLENYDDHAALARPDHAYEGRWNGQTFTWVRVKPTREP